MSPLPKTVLWLATVYGSFQSEGLPRSASGEYGYPYPT